jgi:hypothetical protein
MWRCFALASLWIYVSWPALAQQAAADEDLGSGPIDWRPQWQDPALPLLAPYPGGGWLLPPENASLWRPGPAPVSSSDPHRASLRGLRAPSALGGRVPQVDAPWTPQLDAPCPPPFERCASTP